MHNDLQMRRGVSNNFGCMTERVSTKDHNVGTIVQTGEIGSQVKANYKDSSSSTKIKMENASVQKNIKNKEKDITCDLLKVPNDSDSSPIDYKQKAYDSNIF